MATLNDRVFDNGLTVLDTEGNRVDICSQEPTTYAAATSTYTLGNETSISVSAPANATPNGRKVTLAAITGASVTGTGTATGSLSASQAVTSGNTFSLTASDIRIPDPA